LLQCGPRGLVLVCHVSYHLVTKSDYKVALQYWLCSYTSHWCYWYGYLSPFKKLDSTLF